MKLLPKTKNPAGSNVGVRTILAAAIYTVSLVAPATAAEMDIFWTDLQDPGLKDAVFASYQGNHFAAITRLQSEQKQGRIKQTQKGGLVLGGLYLAYGLHQEAARIFEALLDRDQPLPVRNQTWFYLGKIQYQRQQYAEALKSFKRIRGSLDLSLETERQVLESTTQIRLGQFSNALIGLSTIGSSSGWYNYARYNMGVAYYQAGHKDLGKKVLDEIGSIGKATGESLEIKNKANMMLGYGYLTDGDPETAKIYLKRMMLSGKHSSRALLALGRSYSAKKEHKKSLVPWMELIERNPSDPAVQDALMAVPYALGQMEAYSMSLTHYENAMQTFQREIDRINTAANAIGGGKLFEGLLRAESGESIGGLWDLDKVLKTPEGRYLWNLIASHAFVETFYNYKQLRLSLGKLESWSAKINTYSTLSDIQRAQYKRRLIKLQSRILVAAEKVNRHLQTLAYDELDRRKKRLVSYFNEARFSVAQIYDYSSRRWGNTGEK